MESEPIDIDIQTEKNRGRYETRIVEIYNNLKDIDDKWSGLESIIKVNRLVIKKNKETEETAYFISSVSSITLAKTFNQWIRSHWSIENSLHYTKDKTFKEDESKIRTGNAPENISLIRNIVINIFRQNGYTNMAQAIRLVSNDILKLWDIILA
jgi:predicted transposase YbfD/YdcC